MVLQQYRNTGIRFYRRPFSIKGAFLTSPFALLPFAFYTLFMRCMFSPNTRMMRASRCMLKYIPVRLLQLKNAFLPIVTTVFGSVTVLNPVHPSKALPPIDATPSLISSDTRLVHPENMPLLITVTAGGIVMESSPLHPEKA